MSQCRYCGARIRWVTTATRYKKMPVDLPAEVRMLETEDGTFTPVSVYRTHFETCPNAAEARNR